eukprot:TRINITY_DN176_c0_g1_i6.p2 TRINITY_DN176_c0_g1~~TRINITY_DN176_c0_g1_i6.p2  ORF type:complete len:100 (+),score=2.24 TRINITY_DN176_c0_g1_i6:32-301(+)
MAPQRTNLVLATHIPHSESDVAILDCLDVEANSGNGGHHLSQLQLVQNCCFTSGIQTHHQNAHFLLSKHALPELRKRGTPHVLCVDTTA